ncbi:hypothetical protein C5C13_03490 [Clavibacter michiganensis]|nr:hypothetical protein C5C13_03490 [Clavibacter michiganensis]
MRAEAVPAGATEPGRQPLRPALTAVAVLALVGGLTLVGTRASAVLLDVPENGTPGYLSLSSDWSTDMLDVSPGAPGHWLIAARLRDADVARLAVEIRSGGELADVDAGVVLRVDRCDDAWIPAPAAEGSHAAPACPEGSAPVLAATPLSAFRAEGPRTGLPDITAAAGEHLLLTASVDPARAGDSRAMGRTGSLAVGLTAMGADPAPAAAAPPPVGGILPRTGSALDVVAVALAGAGALALGLLMRRPGMRRRPGLALDDADRGRA